jgi:sulfofructosephosphate aldolase
VIWRGDDHRARRVEMARRFVELARANGLLSVLEPVVRGPGGFDREAAIVEAAAELGAVGCDLYKCEVPLRGVDPAGFPAAVEAACRGGASGMLAGRAVWTAALAAEDPMELLRSHSVPRLRQLAAIVDRHGRPWREKR